MITNDTSNLHATDKSGDGLPLLLYAAASALLPYAAATVLILFGQSA